MPPAIVKSTAELPAGATRIAVIADTHSTPHPNTHRLLREQKPDAILHAGDIGELEVLDGLRDIAPLFAVRGNIDTRAAQLPDHLTIDAGSFKIFLTHIGVAGPHIRADVQKLARADQASLVVCGHSHVPFLGGAKGLTVFNPGSAGPRRFHLPIVFGMMELVNGKIRFGHIDCETGTAWSPPSL